jgi:uncharacterized membrane protein YkoI
MRDKLKGALIATAVIAALATGGAAIAGAAGGGEDNRPDKAITGPALERASQAALQETGGGRVTETEAGDEEGAYEVEVTKADGSQVDVHLDTGFQVRAAENDGEDRDDED